MKTRLIGFAAAFALTGAGAVMLTAPSAAQQQQPAAQPPATTPTPPAQPQFVWPARMQNARVLPADIGAERLRGTMVSFARSLGVRCTFCHVGEEGAPLHTLDFVSDANPHKNVARDMMRMARRLNETDLPAMLGAAQAPRVTCFTCHRGAATPATQLPPLPQQ
jgi:Photosynthetic reaction centre cytochrome C subunit